MAEGELEPPYQSGYFTPPTLVTTSVAAILLAGSAYIWRSNFRNGLTNDERRSDELQGHSQPSSSKSRVRLAGTDLNGGQDDVKDSKLIPRSKERRRRGKDPLKELLKGGKKGKGLGKLAKLIEGASDSSPLGASFPTSSTEPSRSRDSSQVRSVTTSSRSASSSSSVRRPILADYTEEHEERRSGTGDADDDDSTPNGNHGNEPSDYLAQPPSIDPLPPPPSETSVPSSTSKASSISDTSEISLFTSISLESISSQSSVDFEQHSNTPTPITAVKDSIHARNHFAPDGPAGPAAPDFGPGSDIASRRTVSKSSTKAFTLPSTALVSTNVATPSSPSARLGSLSRKLIATGDFGTPRRAATPNRPSTPLSNPGTPPPSLSIQTQLASLRGALEASRMREDKARTDFDQCLKERDALRWEQATWRQREMEMQAQIHNLIHQLQSYASIVTNMNMQTNGASSPHLQVPLQMGQVSHSNSPNGYHVSLPSSPSPQPQQALQMLSPAGLLPSPSGHFSPMYPSPISPFFNFPNRNSSQQPSLHTQPHSPQTTAGSQLYETIFPAAAGPSASASPLTDSLPSDAQLAAMLDRGRTRTRNRTQTAHASIGRGGANGWSNGDNDAIEDLEGDDDPGVSEVLADAILKRPGSIQFGSRKKRRDSDRIISPLRPSPPLPTQPTTPGFEEQVEFTFPSLLSTPIGNGHTKPDTYFAGQHIQDGWIESVPPSASPVPPRASPLPIKADAAVDEAVDAYFSSIQ